WAMENGRPEVAINVARDIRYWYYVRGLWSAEPDVNLLRATAAKAIDDVQEEFDALVYHVNIAAKQENQVEVERHLPRLQELAQTRGAELAKKSLAGFRHARALHLLATGDLAGAEQEWRLNLEDPE